MFLTAGRHTRLPAVARLRSACLTTLIALVAEFGLGMWLNIYVPVPPADQHAGIVREIANGPLLLTTHILVGVFLIGAAIVLLVRAVNVGLTKVVVLASVSLAAVLGAFGAGDFFARDGESRTSFWMALLTGVALLCCICVQALTAGADLAPALEPEPEPAARAPYRRAAVPPQPAHAANPPAPGWPDPRRPDGMGRHRPGYGRGAPAYREAPSGPQPVPMPRPRGAYPPAVPRRNLPRQDLPRYDLPRQGRPEAGRENTPPWRPDWRSSGYPEEP
jgi:hypothetical protein